VEIVQKEIMIINKNIEEEAKEILNEKEKKKKKER